MAESGLMISQMYDVTLVNFRHSSLLDGAAVQAVGKELYELADRQARRKILLDFGEVRFLSSTMLGVLIDLHKKLKAIEGRMVVCGLKPDLKKVFKIMRLEKVLLFADSEDEGLRKLEAKSK